ncbi:MAG: hypothetical protein ACI379_04550 [Nocardioides sp.]|uniref:hypothetical protein n=1 Tax=Nocardioides sp. TaxID=35761 RepID=UPI003EFF20DF
MTRMLRAVLALAFAMLGLGLVVGGTAPAYACSCAEGTVKQQLKRADVVFVGTVVKKTDGPRTGDVTYEVHASTLFKGEVDYATQVTSAADGAACGLENVRLDEDYVFFASNDEAPFYAGLCSGSGPAKPALITKLEGFAKPTSIEVPPPPKPTLTPSDTSEPTGFARLAAPGAAVAVVGLLGLLVVGRLARR